MVGSQIGNFRIISKLGEGGMGVVYRGIDVQLDRPVAIKMLSSELARMPDLVQRFQSEAKAQANLNHTNLATLYTFLVQDGNAFMVMEFIEGETFEQIIRRGGPMSARDAVPLFKQALLGIGAAHRVGIIHRDIKPSNLMLNRQGIVKVMDFGIAKVVGSRGMTRTGMQLGTLSYMSPEQIQNRVVDIRSDIYALGVTLYEMLSGHVPFESDSDFQVMHDHVATPPPALTRAYPYAPREFENVVAKALEKNPDNRFQTVEEFGAALEHPEAIAAPTYSQAGAPAGPIRATTIESGFGSGSTGTAAATAPISRTPAGTVVQSQATYAGQPQAVAAGEPQATVSNPAGRAPAKLIIGAVALIAIAAAGIAFWPGKTPPKPPVVQQTANKPQPAAQPANDSPNILVASGGGTPATDAGSGAPSDKATAKPETSSATDASKRTPRQQPNSSPATNRTQPSQPQQSQAQQAQSQTQTQTQTAQNQPPPQQTQTQSTAPPPQYQPQQYQPQPQQQQPQPQPQHQQAAQAQTFLVKHRHIVMNGFQSVTFFCGGYLSVRPDGSVTYICGATNDPSGRCDKVMFPTGTIKQVKLRGGGELHISTTGMGNWDFYDYTIAGSTASAYQALIPLAR